MSNILDITYLTNTTKELVYRCRDRVVRLFGGFFLGCVYALLGCAGFAQPVNKLAAVEEISNRAKGIHVAKANGIGFFFDSIKETYMALYLQKSSYFRYFLLSFTGNRTNGFWPDSKTMSVYIPEASFSIFTPSERIWNGYRNYLTRATYCSPIFNIHCGQSQFSPHVSSRILTDRKNVNHRQASSLLIDVRVDDHSGHFRRSQLLPHERELTIGGSSGFPGENGSGAHLLPLASSVIDSSSQQYPGDNRDQNSGQGNQVSYPIRLGSMLTIIGIFFGSVDSFLSISSLV
jgi:hypothetical protein